MIRRAVERALGGAAVLGTVQASGKVFGSRLFAQAAGFVAAIMVARALGPDAFGLYSLMLILATILSELPGAGLDLSAVRLSARDWPRDPRRGRGVLVLAGATKAAFGLTLLLLGVVLGGPIVARTLGRPELQWPIQCAALAGVALAVTDTLMASLQARERFGQMFWVNAIVVTIKLAPVALLLGVGALTLTNATLAFLIAAYVGCGVAAVYAWRAAGGGASWDRAVARELFTFSRWFVLATLLGILTSGLDLLMLTYLAGPEATGVYASARTLALPLAVAGGAIGAVLLPRLSRMAANGEEIGPYLRRVLLRLAAGVAVVGFGVAVLAPPIVSVVYGGRYASAVPVFQALSVAYCVQILTWPVLLVMLVRDRPDIVAKLSLVVLGVVAAGYVLVIPSAGAVGAAWVYVASCALVFFPYLGLSWWFLRAGWPVPAGRPAS